MTPRTFLVLMTAIAVVGDSLLHPFYPQYFRFVFAVSDARYVGLYVAACSLTVLLSFPVWAALSRRVRVLRLLIVTQSVACGLALVSFTMVSLRGFWIATLLMLVFKASYLLIYPYVMSLEDKSRHVHTIGLLAFVVYFGHILAALAAGFVFQLLGPRSLFLVMAAGDALQTALCVSVIGARALGGEVSVRRGAAPQAPRQFFYKLGLVMFVLYFSAYLTEPFFAEYWEARSAIANRVVSGFVFAIPGIAALFGLVVNARAKTQRDDGASMAWTILLALAGLVLQLSGEPLVLVAGRCLYGWGLFQAMVRLDLLVFRASVPENYALDFSRVNLFQGLGVMVASSLAGSTVHALGSATPFIVAASGFAVGAALYLGLLRFPGGTSAKPQVLTP